MDAKLNEEILNHTTFGLISLLQQKPYVCDIKFKKHEPVVENMLSIWEESNGCVLPEDVKKFYRTMNGLLVQWKVKFKGEEIEIGLVEINPVEALNTVTLRPNNCGMALSDLMDTGDYEAKQQPGNMFELSSDGQHGKICLVHKGGDDFEVWLIDMSMQWHFMAPNFCQYFRMLIFNLGIRGWQFLYTDYGLTPETKQWFSFCLPHRITDNQHDNNTTKGSSDINEASSQKKQQQQQQAHKIDFNALFKQKKKPKETATTGGTSSNEQVSSKKKQNSTGYKSRSNAPGNKSHHNKFK